MHCWHLQELLHLYYPVRILEYSFRHAGRFENEGRTRLTGPLSSESDVSGAGCGCFCCSAFSMVSSTLCTPASVSVNNFIAALIFPWKTSFAKVLALFFLLRLSFEENRFWIVWHSWISSSILQSFQAASLSSSILQCSCDLLVFGAWQLVILYRLLV